MAAVNALDRMPPDLTEKHTRVARLLLGRPEGVTREEATLRLMMPDRAFRQLVEDITTSGWLPIVADRGNGGEARYRIARADETDLVNAASREDYARAVSLHKRSRGRVQAFQAHHSAGDLFLASVPEEVA